MVSNKYNNKDNKLCPIMLVSAKIDGTYCVGQVVPDTKRKTIWITSVRIQKADVGSQVPNSNNITPQLTSETPLVSSSASNTTISQNDNGVNDSIRSKGENNSLLTARIEAQSRNNEAIAVEDVQKATGLGDYGSNLIAELANSEGMTFSQAEKAVKTAYMAGFADVDSAKVDFVTDTQIDAFYAGKKDRVMQDLSAKENAKNATVYDGAFTENEYTKDFSKSERKMISTVAKSLKMDVSVVDKIIANVVNGRVFEANAEHKDGKMRISSTTEKIIYELVMHEGGHRMRQLAPTEFGVLMDALYERAVRRAAKSGASGNLIFDNVKAEHDNAGITMDTSGYLEEFAVRELETIFSSAREFNRWYAEISGNQQVRTNFEKFIDWIYEVIDDIKRALKQAKMSKAERAEANAELDRIKRLLANTYMAAENVASERTKEVQSERAQKKSAESSMDKVRSFSFRDSKSGTANDLLTAYNEELTRLIEQRGDYIVDSFEKLKEIVNLAFDNPQLKATAYFGIIPTEVLNKIEKSTPNIPKELNGTLFKSNKDYSVAATFDSIRHLVDEKKLSRDDVIDYLDRMADTIVEFDEVNFNHYYQGTTKNNGLIFKKTFNDGVIQSFEIISNKKRSLNLHTVYMAKGDYIKKKSAETMLMDNPSAHVQDAGRSNFTNSISQTEEKSQENLPSFSLKEEISSDNLENKAKTEYNGNKSYSLYTDEVMFSSRYNVISQSQNIRGLYDDAKRGNAESAYDLLSQLLKDDDINKIKSFGNDVYLLPVVGAEGTSTNVLPRTIAEYISEETSQNVFKGIYKETSSDSRKKPLWDRMKENYPSFVIGKNTNIKKSDIAGKKFILIDDNSTTGRTFVGLRNFLEENGGEVVSYYALTTGQDQSEKMVTTNETWNEILSIGLKTVRDFAEEEGVKREISEHGLTEREAQEVVRQFRGKKADSGRGNEDATRSGRGGRKVQKIHDTEKENGGKENDNGVNLSLKEETSSDNLENKAKTEYSGNKSYSLKWRTDLNKTQYTQVEKWIRQAGNPEATRITDTANWYKGRIDGEDLFVIYSDKSTILYERKGVEGKAELDILLKRLEEIENGRSIVDVSKHINTLLSGDWLQEKHNLANNNAGLGGRGSNIGHASILQRKSSEFIGSQAFRNVVKNLFNIQEKAEKIKNLSLKGGVSATELLDTIDDARKGKKKAVDKLSEYVDGGIMSSELYDELIEKYGTIPAGENPHRDVQVPRKTEKNKKVSQTVRTILEARVTPDEALPSIEELVTKGEFSYDAYTDKDAIAEADETIAKKSWEKAKADWYKSVGKGEVSKKNTALGWAIYNNAVNSGETETALEVLDFMVRHQRSAAQALQATRILKKLSPETQLYGVQKSVNALQEELKEKYGKKAPNLEIDKDLAEKFLNAQTSDERAAIEKEIYRDIGRQMPSRFIDKWNAWRYLSMLGNARTHIRNVVGNAGITFDLTFSCCWDIII